MDKKKENNPKVKPKVKLTKEELLAGKIVPDSEADKLAPLEDPLFRSPDDFLSKVKKPLPAQPNRKPKQAPKVAEKPAPKKTEARPEPKPEPKSLDSIVKETNGVEGTYILKDEEQYTDPHVNTRYMKPRHRLNGKQPTESAPAQKPTPTPLRTDKNTKSDLLLKTIYEMKYRHEKEITRWKLYEQQVNNWKDRVLMIVGQLKKELIKSKSDLREMDALKVALKQKTDELNKLKKAPSPEPKKK